MRVSPRRSAVSVILKLVWQQQPCHSQRSHLRSLRKKNKFFFSPFRFSSFCLLLSPSGKDSFFPTSFDIKGELTFRLLQATSSTTANLLLFKVEVLLAVMPVLTHIGLYGIGYALYIFNNALNYAFKIEMWSSRDSSWPLSS